ncbi:fumarylacetoacetate hydrolase family protein [Shewanella sp. H8]|uniref:fumarylacetoacetate hydrolase family protein n=1 Tax=Shewanella sp. H8 TaxID=3342676 RepID=UPI00331608D6
MVQSININNIAKHLFLQRQTVDPISDLATANQIDTIDLALGIQLAMIDLNQQHVTGWKCLTPRDNGDLIVAPILAKAIINHTQCPIFSSAHRALIEPEIAFVVGQSFAADRHYSDAEIDQHIGATHMALELIQQRFSRDYNASFLEKLADGLSNQGVYLGPEIDKFKAFKASHIHLTVTQNDASRTYDGAHPCTLPASPLYWIVNFLTARGIEISAGQVIITGSYCGVLKVDMNKPVQIKYQGLGSMALSFTELSAN